MGFILGIIGLIFVLILILFIPLFLMLIYVTPFMIYLDEKSREDLIKWNRSDFSDEIILFILAYKDFIKISLLATKCYLCWLTLRCPKNPTQLFNFKSSLNKLADNSINTLDKLNNLDNVNSKIEQFFDNKIIKVNNFSNKLDNLTAKIDESTKRQLARNERDKAKLKAFFNPKYKKES